MVGVDGPFVGCANQVASQNIFLLESAKVEKRTDVSLFILLVLLCISWSSFACDAHLFQYNVHLIH